MWTPAAKQFIINNAPFMKDEDIGLKLSVMLGRKVSTNAVRKMRQKLGIKKLHGRGKVGIDDGTQSNTSVITSMEVILENFRKDKRND